MHRLAVTFGSVIATFSACGSSDPAPIDSAGATVTIDALATDGPSNLLTITILDHSDQACATGCFDPTPATVALVGGNAHITFVNADDDGVSDNHAICGGELAGDCLWTMSDLLMPSDTHSATLTAAGTYAYFCPIHPWAQGTIEVLAP